MKENRNGYLQLGVVQIHRLYQKHPKRKSPPVKDIKLYREVLNFLFTRVWYYIFTENWIFKAPAKMGYFYVSQSFGSTGFYKDWGKTRERGKLTKNYNAHTDGLKFYIKWDKINSVTKHLSFYKYKSYRGSAEEFTGSRGLAHHIKKCSENPNVPDFKGHV